MSYLFIDSTYDLTLGVLDDGFEWLSFERFSGQKASAIIQTKSYELLHRHGLRTEKLSGVITVKGPGFYTGLRLAEGFSDVFKYFGVRQFSFYSYEIPNWCGFHSGVWFTKAYRGEYFFYRWNQEEAFQELVSSKNLEKELIEDKYFIHSSVSLDDISSALIKDPTETHILLQKHSKLIFKQVIDFDLQRDPFYFRAPEDEFKVNP